MPDNDVIIATFRLRAVCPKDFENCPPARLDAKGWSFVDRSDSALALSNASAASIAVQAKLRAEYNCVRAPERARRKWNQCLKPKKEPTETEISVGTREESKQQWQVTALMRIAKATRKRRSRLARNSHGRSALPCP